LFFTYLSPDIKNASLASSSRDLGRVWLETLKASLAKHGDFTSKTLGFDPKNSWGLISEDLSSFLLTTFVV